MPSIIRSATRHSLEIIIILLLLLAGLMYVGYEYQNENLNRYLEQNLQKDFLRLCSDLEEESAEALQFYSEPDIFNHEPGYPVCRVLVTLEGEIVKWSETDFLPSYPVLSRYLNAEKPVFFTDQGRYFYLIPIADETHRLLNIIPIEFSYPIHNSSLPTVRFLGRYTDDFFVEQTRDCAEIFNRNAPGSIQITDASSKYLFSIQVMDRTPFLVGQQVWVLLLLSLALLLIPFSVQRYMQQNLGIWGDLVAIVCVLAIRSFFFLRWPSLPFEHLSLFDPGILAINVLTPSLGDFVLNTWVIAWMAFLVSRILQRNHLLIQGFIRSKRLYRAAFFYLHMLLSGFLLLIFFSMYSSVDENSVIPFDFTNIYELNFNSLLLLLSFGFILSGEISVILQAMRLVYGYLTDPPGQMVRMVRMLTALLLVVLLGMYSTGLTWVHGLCAAVAIGFIFIIVDRNQSASLFNLDFLNFLSIVLIFSSMTTVAIVNGKRHAIQANAERMAEKLSEERDFITEFMFGKISARLKDTDVVLYKEYLSDSTNGDFTDWVNEKYFKPNFKGYEIRLFLYDVFYRKVDSLRSGSPVIAPYQNLSRFPNAISTISNAFYLFPATDPGKSHYYAGQLNIKVKGLGKLYAILELYPTSVESGRVYPQLLLDEKVLARSKLPAEYRYAIYKQKKLRNFSPGGQFPLFLQAPEGLSPGLLMTVRDHSGTKVFYAPDATTVIEVHCPESNVFSSLTIFSFVSYAYLILLSLAFLVAWAILKLQRRSSAGILQLNLSSKIQLMFLAMAILPLVIIIIFLTPYIRSRVYEDATKDLNSKTAHVSQLVLQDMESYVTYKKLNTFLYKRVRQKINTIEDNLLNDINIYNAEGRLEFTTQPAIFDLGLASTFMNPDVYASLRQGIRSEMAVVEKIGNMEFLSGYYPLISKENEIIGYVNIPYLSRQEQLNIQMQKLIAFFVDVYVVVFLCIAIIAFIVSNSIVRPLTLLQRRLEETSLGTENKPIEWGSRDEIGQIISSYNHMLVKLAQSEKKLASTERELAWKEMARQVAHEIKNPLMPMKLSVQHLVRAWKEQHPNLPKMFDKVTATILVQIDSLTGIANSFSEFARMPEPQKEECRLNEIVQQVADLYSHHDHARIEVEIRTGDYRMYTDPDQLSRVINNVVKNALQAIQDKDGLVRIFAYRTTTHLNLEISDNGDGIPEDIRPRIFQPNFSTKTSGMGLGLAIVKKIIEYNGGTITFSSTLGEGTTFYISLPAMDAGGPAA